MKKYSNFFSNHFFLFQNTTQDIWKQNKYRVVCIFSSYMPLIETSEHNVLNLVKLI